MQRLQLIISRSERVESPITCQLSYSSNSTTANLHAKEKKSRIFLQLLYKRADLNIRDCIFQLRMKHFGETKAQTKIKMTTLTQTVH